MVILVVSRLGTRFQAPDEVPHTTLAARGVLCCTLAVTSAHAAVPLNPDPPRFMIVRGDGVVDLGVGARLVRGVLVLPVCRLLRVLVVGSGVVLSSAAGSR